VRVRAYETRVHGALDERYETCAGGDYRSGRAIPLAENKTLISQSTINLRLHRCTVFLMPCHRFRRGGSGIASNIRICGQPSSDVNGDDDPRLNVPAQDRAPAATEYAGDPKDRKPRTGENAPLLAVSEVTNAHGGFKARDRCSVSFERGMITGVIGPYYGAGQDDADQRP